jgi:hypothetical protein
MNTVSTGFDGLLTVVLLVAVVALIVYLARRGRGG